MNQHESRKERIFLCDLKVQENPVFTHTATEQEKDT